MHYLVNGVVATGADVFHLGQSPAPTAEDSDNDSASAHSDAGADPSGTGSSSSSTNVLDDHVASEIMEDDIPAKVCNFTFFFQCIL